MTNIFPNVYVIVYDKYMHDLFLEAAIVHNNPTLLAFEVLVFVVKYLE